MDKNQTTGTPTEEKDAMIATAFTLFDRWVDEATKRGEADKEVVKLFAKAHNVADTSPLALMYWAFEGGLGKGLELADTIRNS